MGALAFVTFSTGMLAVFGVINPPAAWLRWTAQVIGIVMAIVTGIIAMVRMRSGQSATHRYCAWAGIGWAFSWALLLLVAELDPS